MEFFVGGGLLRKVVPAELVVVLGESLKERVCFQTFLMLSDQLLMRNQK